MNKPSGRDQLSVQNFLENGDAAEGQRVRPLVAADTQFVYHKEDLVTLRPGRESAWLDALVERVLRVLHGRVVEVSIQGSSRRNICAKGWCSQVYIL